MKGCIIANNVCKLSWLSVNPTSHKFLASEKKQARQASTRSCGGWVSNEVKARTFRKYTFTIDSQTVTGIEKNNVAVAQKHLSVNWQTKKNHQSTDGQWMAESQLRDILEGVRLYYCVTER